MPKLQTLLPPEFRNRVDGFHGLDLEGSGPIKAARLAKDLIFELLNTPMPSPSIAAIACQPPRLEHGK